PAWPFAPIPRALEEEHAVCGEQRGRGPQEFERTRHMLEDVEGAETGHAWGQGQRLQGSRVDAGSECATGEIDSPWTQFRALGGKASLGEEVNEYAVVTVDFEDPRGRFRELQEVREPEETALGEIGARALLDRQQVPLHLVLVPVAVPVEI